MFFSLDISSFLPQDTVGFNIAGLQFLKKHLEEKDEVMFFSDATKTYKAKKKKQKQKVILSIKT